ncbi:MAG: Uma2 family endonuclease [Chloroflexi bacterium]|nr:Uma2 family endonuclease [Chloroflexota bacterium]MCC6891468.1 Uma2 family endonuclease [Anaerolineae bacterium]
MTIHERLYTVDDLWAISHDPANELRRFELSEGVLIEMTPASFKHGRDTSRLNRFISEFVDKHKLGETTAAETGYILYKNPNGKDTVRAPDVGFVSVTRISEQGFPDGYFPGAPDLAVEVISPTDEAEEVHFKVTQYLKYGTRLIWLVYRKSQTVVVHTVNGSRTLSVDDFLDGGDLLPGFRLPVRDIFE